MQSSSTRAHRNAYPSLSRRISSVWYRHMRVYTKNLISNGLPPFLEPLIFLAGIGLGLGKFIGEMDGVPYLQYLATGLLVSAAMYTATFECSFGTFIRMEFDKVYEGMLSSPMTVNDLLIGEILWAATKGLFFSFAVLVVISIFGILPLTAMMLLTPFAGFIAGAMFATLSLLVTSFVKNINHFNFYFTGIISPMFFFSGIVYPIENLPTWIRPLSEALPLTHAVRLVRFLGIGKMPPSLTFDVAYVILFTGITAFLAIHRLRKRLID